MRMEVLAPVEHHSSDFALTWPSPPERPELAGREIHVWSARLLRPDFDYPAGLRMLSESEQQRAATFHFDRDRKNFIARRAMLRGILGHYLKAEPARVSLASEERGKPRLAGADGPPPLHFNFSHSRNLALFAVSRFSPLGVDVEMIRPMPEMREIAAGFCSKAENVLLQAAAPEQNLEVFFSLWTRKEAFLKATGEGIAGNLAQLDCSVAPPSWSFHSLSPAPGFVGALAAAAGGPEPQCWQWLPQ
jgi:4'-phosphopantetheinyl transferase